MDRQIWGLITVLALVVSVDETAHAKAKNPQEPVVVESLAYEGNGCPAGSVAYTISPDSQAVTLLFDQFIAEVGPGVPFSQARASCVVELVLHAAEGKSVAVLHADFRGFVDLQPGVVATVTAGFKSDDDLLASLVSDFFGPTSHDYQLALQSSVKELAWSDCDGAATLRIDLGLLLQNSSNPPASGLVTFDSVDGEVRQGGKGQLKFKISTKHCR